jgi:SOS-response transcriptional repressor LexA
MNIIADERYFEEVEKLLSEGKEVELRCTGGSMHPYLRGDGKEIIVVSPFLQDELKPGKIVLFRYHGKFICHRIIQRKGETILIQGDGVCKNKEQVKVPNIIGIVHTIIRPGKNPKSTQSVGARWYWRWWYFLRSVRRPLLIAYRLKLRVINS